MTKKKNEPVYSTGFEPVYRVKGRITTERPEDGDYEVAARKCIYRDGNLSPENRDMVIKDNCWVDGNEPGAYSKAIELRKKNA